MTNEIPEPAGVDTAWRDENHTDLVADFPSPDEIPHHQPTYEEEAEAPGVLETVDMDVFYGDFKAVADVSLNFATNQISALIGPSGCGKSTVLRSLNRMNDLIPTAHTTGEVRYHGCLLYTSPSPRDHG